MKCQHTLKFKAKQKDKKMTHFLLFREQSHRNLKDSCIEVRLPCSSNGKESACHAEGQGSIPGLGSSSGEGNGNPLQ